jgi:hypothetical protein
MTNPEHVDEYAETQVLVEKPARSPVLDDDTDAEALYAEYVRELERSPNATSSGAARARRG